MSVYLWFTRVWPTLDGPAEQRLAGVFTWGIPAADAIERAYYGHAPDRDAGEFLRWVHVADWRQYEHDNGVLPGTLREVHAMDGDDFTGHYLIEIEPQGDADVPA